MSTHTHSDRPTRWSRRLMLSVAYLSAIALFGFALAVFLLVKDRSANVVGAFVGVTWAVPVAALAITIAAAFGVGHSPEQALARGRIAGLAELAVVVFGTALVGVALASARGWSAVGAVVPIVVLVLTIRTAIRHLRVGLDTR